MKLYFAGSTFGGVLKIGISANPSARISLLTRGCPFDITLFAVLSPRKPKTVEQRLHELLCAHRSRGEWFYLSAPVAAVVHVAQKTRRANDVLKEAEKQAAMARTTEVAHDGFNNGMLRYCAFCGLSHLVVGSMVTGAAANICDKCVTRCSAILSNGKEASTYHGMRLTREGELDDAISKLQ